MEIPSTRFDAIDPFAQGMPQMKLAETVLRQLPPAQREQLLAELQPSIPMRQPSPTIEPAVTMVTVKVEDWDGGMTARASAPMMIRRPRRIVGRIPWQQVWIVACILLGRRLQRVAWKQLRLTLKTSRWVLRRVLPRRKGMRGATAR